MLEDLRHSFRLLIKNPRISALIILILGLGIGLNTTVFSFLEATILDPFPYEDPGRLVEVVQGSRQRWTGPFNYRAYEALRESNAAQQVFAGVAGYRQRPITIAIGEVPESTFGAEVTPELFDLLGVEPLLGRSFTAAEQGAGRAPVAIISHELWKTRFGANRGVLGETIGIDGTDRTIVGVMPPGFAFYQASTVWIPLPVDATAAADEPYRFAVLGRMQSGITLAQARAAVETLRGTIDALLGAPANEYEAQQRERGLTVRTLAEGWNTAGLGFVGVVFQIAAGFVLLIVCGNLASLLLARGVARRREIAVRRALGAPRGRLVRQILTENGLLAVAGGVAGILVAIWGQRLFLAAFPPTPLLAGLELGLDTGILAFALGLATICVLVFGAAPALQLSRIEVNDTLRESGFGATGSRRSRRWQGGLAIVQIAFSMLLLIGASLTARSMVAIQQVDPGFDAERVFEVWPSFSSSYPDAARGATTRRIIAALEMLPGLESVASTNYATPNVRGNGRGFIERREGLSLLSAFNLGDTVSREYFRTFGLPLVRGRLFDDQDQPGTPWVVVLSERAAQILFPDDDAVGKQIRFPGSREWLTVIGIVGDVVRVTNYNLERTDLGIFATAWPDIYFAGSQFDTPPSIPLYVRPRVDRATLWQLVRGAIAEVDPDVPVLAIRSVQEGVYEPNRLAYLLVGRILTALGLIALILSALGTYSVISHAWAQRSREVGVRVAFGATAGDVLKLVLRHTQKLALTGVGLGMALSLALYRLATNLFFGVSSWDPLTYVGLAIVLLAMAAAAGFSPARRATRTNPVEVLRQE